QYLDDLEDQVGEIECEQDLPAVRDGTPPEPCKPGDDPRHEKQIEEPVFQHHEKVGPGEAALPKTGQINVLAAVVANRAAPLPTQPLPDQAPPRSRHVRVALSVGSEGDPVAGAANAHGQVEVLAGGDIPTHGALESLAAKGGQSAGGNVQDAQPR